MMYEELTLETDGRGYWSDVEKKVRIRNMSLIEFFDDHGELRVYFDRRYWKTGRDGLIYTDPEFLRGLRKYLRKYRWPANSVDYSEQGMQGDDYVSLDAGPSFVRMWRKRS